MNTQEFPGIVAALVTSFENHPNADRLRLVSLAVGDSTVSPVVCGASNFDVGDTVALALPGAVILHNVHSEAHESFTLGTAKIRGIESQGMVCSAFELGLAEEPGEGVMLLKHDTKPGSQFEAEMVK